MSGPWNVETGDGRVTLRLPRDFAANLDANSGDGAISVDLPSNTSYSRRERHNIRATINRGGPTLSVRSGDGAINVSGL